MKKIFPKWWLNGEEKIHGTIRKKLTKKNKHKKRHLDVSKNVDTQQPWVFLLKMIILGCFGGIPIFGNTHLKITILETPKSPKFVQMFSIFILGFAALHCL